MHLVAIHTDGPRQAATIALVRRQRRGIAKVYAVTAATGLPPETPAEALAEHIETLYRRRDLSVTETRFSQIGRPRKRSLKGPTILVAGHPDNTLLSALQRRRILFHAVLARADDPAWTVCSLAGRPGGVFWVPPELLTASLEAVRRSGRIAVDDAAGAPLPPASGLARAVAACVWYEENLPQIRRRQPAAAWLPA